MTSVFIAFMFYQNYLGKRKITNNDKEEFRELTYKGFIADQEPLITALETNSIVLMVGRYVFEDTEYFTLVQTVPIFTSTNEIEITPDDLPHSPPLLLYSAPVVSNFYFSDKEFGRENFMLSKKLYNGVTGHKNIESELLEDLKSEQGKSSSRKRKETNLLPTSFSKTQRTSSKPQNNKPQSDNPKNNNTQNDKPQINNLLNAIFQIKDTGSQPQKDVE
ncbi:hypothetical protein C2G38_2197726 [Gigaspora rosea]|uniref:Uncharacterized protein n=1 Tax=Gigaspora rosea TaxID=44941 RepID=A0A397UVW4_9GLOM|nr:hypothetical protein C2G38_2197726 [Gigaspora rosea]